MKLDKELAEQLRIPTVGMTELCLSIMKKTGHYESRNEVRAFSENGKLHRGHNGPTEPAYFIQREDGQLFVGRLFDKLPIHGNLGVVCDTDIRSKLKAGVKADLIVVDVDADCMKYHKKLFLNFHYGPLAFLAEHHPDEYAREVAWVKMAEVFMATESEEEKAAFREVFQARADKLGINYAQANSSRTH